MEFKHISVLLDETIEELHIKPDGIYVDGTLGGGGHAYHVCQKLSEKGRYIGIDQDADAIAASTKRLEPFKDKVTIVRDNYVNMPKVLHDLGIEHVDGILLDLGVSSFQLDEKERGFTYREDVPLDMRMDQRQSLTARDIVNEYSEMELFHIIRDYGEEKFAKNIAKHIVNAAAHIEATDASAEMITEAKRDNRSAKLHFSVQDMFCLPYADGSFDAVIVSNALHIVPQPEKALREIRRVLKDDGVLIAPTFTHAGNSFSGKVRAFFMKLAGFPLHSRWTSKEYLTFLRQNGWTVRKSAVLKASFPLTYAECVKMEV